MGRMKRAAHEAGTPRRLLALLHAIAVAAVLALVAAAASAPAAASAARYGPADVETIPLHVPVPAAAASAAASAPADDDAAAAGRPGAVHARAARVGRDGRDHTPRRIRLQQELKQAGAAAAAAAPAYSQEAELVELQARAREEADARGRAAEELRSRVTSAAEDEANDQAAAVVLEALGRLPEDQRVVAHMAQSFLAGVVESAVQAAEDRAAEEEEAEKEGAVTATASGPRVAIAAPALVETGEAEAAEDAASNTAKPVVGTVNLMRMPRFAEHRAAAKAKAHAKAHARAVAASRTGATATLPPELTREPEFVELQMQVRRRGRGFFKKAWSGIKKVVKTGVGFVKKVFGFGKKKKPEPKKEEPKPKPAAAAAAKPLTREDIEDCFACKMVWAQVEMDVGDARYAEDVQASFEHNCMDAQKSTIFYTACEDMYDDVYAMTDDYMSSKYSVDQICSRAALCKEGAAPAQTTAAAKK